MTSTPRREVRHKHRDKHYAVSSNERYRVFDALGSLAIAFDFTSKENAMEAASGMMAWKGEKYEVREALRMVKPLDEECL